MQSQEVFQKLAGDFPQGDVWQEHAARAVTRLAAWCGTQNEPGRARELLAQELAHRWDLLCRASDRPANHRRFTRALGWSEEKGGPPEPTSGDRLSRLRSWMDKVALESCKTTASAEWAWTKATLHQWLSSELAAHQDLPAARRELELALPLWQDLAKRRPDDLDCALGAARAFCNLTMATKQTDAAGQEFKIVRSYLDWLKGRREHSAGSAQLLDMTMALHKKLTPPPHANASGDLATLQELDRVIADLRGRADRVETVQ
jgi:hypothetical protein